MVAPNPVAASLPQVQRGDSARWFLAGSLDYCARRAEDLPALAPRALEWYFRLALVPLAVPFGVVLDLGYLLLEGESFRFRSTLDAPRGDAQVQAVRDDYETLVLARRLRESRFQRVHRLVRDSHDDDLALTRALELLLTPVAAGLSQPFVVTDPPVPPVDFDGDLAAARVAFEAAVQAPGALLRALREITTQANELDLDRRLEDEDLFEIEYARYFPRQSLRLAARRIKEVARRLGPSRRAGLRAMRDRALADTALESVGTYPTGGIAELTTAGPVENLVPSELVYLEPDEPVDPFLVRFAENEVLRYLRDSAVHRMLRRTVVFAVEDCDEFLGPVSGDLAGTKVIRCLMGLALALAGDLQRVFRRDDIAFRFELLTAPGSAESAEHREMLEVLHLLFRAKEQQGRVVVTASDRGPLEAVEALPREAHRSRCAVVFARPRSLVELSRARPPAGTRVLPVPVYTVEPPGEGQRYALNLTGQILPALREARERLLEGMLG